MRAELNFKQVDWAKEAEGEGPDYEFQVIYTEIFFWFFETALLRSF